MRIGLFPGDARQYAVGRAFTELGHQVSELQMNGEAYDIIIMPMPLSDDDVTVYGSREKLEEWLRYLSGQTVYAGRCSESAMQKAAVLGVNLRDHFAREEETVLNVIPTVEGALELAMRHTDFTLHGSNMLICGFGRIGKQLAYRLQALGARVRVLARKTADFAWCETFGYSFAPIDTLSQWIGSADVIFNTVPVRIFTENELKLLPRDSLLIDVAGRYKGIDELSARQRSNVLCAPALPTQCAPLTAGKIICRTILNMYKEENTRDR